PRLAELSSRSCHCVELITQRTRGAAASGKICVIPCNAMEPNQQMRNGLLRHFLGPDSALLDNENCRLRARNARCRLGAVPFQTTEAQPPGCASCLESANAGKAL